VVPLAMLILLPDPLLGARTRLLPSRLPALMMTFFPLLTSSPIFLPFLPSGAWALFPRARVRLNRLLLRPLLVRDPRPLGRIPFPFLPCPLLSFLHLLLIHLLSSRLFLFLPPPYHPCLCFLRHFTLFFFTFVKSHNVLCHVLSKLTSPVTMCLCVGLSSFFLLLPFYFLLRLGSQPEIQKVFIIVIIIFPFWWLSYNKHSISLRGKGLCLRTSSESPVGG